MKLTQKQKPCPFCGKEGEIKKQTEGIGSGEYYSTCEYFVVKCLNCHATSREILIDSFRDFFPKTTVKDYRENHALRAKHEDEYAEYKKRKKSEALEAWNNRI